MTRALADAIVLTGKILREEPHYHSDGTKYFVLLLLRSFESCETLDVCFCFCFLLQFKVLSLPLSNPGAKNARFSKNSTHHFFLPFKHENSDIA
jgi:hypothetical protein